MNHEASDVERAGDDLEFEMTGELAKSHFGSLFCLFIAVVKDGFRVRLFGEQDVVEDSSYLMRHRGNGLSCPEFSPHPAEKPAEVAFRRA